MIKIINDKLLRALNREVLDSPPIWIMRQAGRYLPEYRQLRANSGNNFMQFCKTPELACQATLLPIKRYPLDAAIIFSDILVIPDAMGLQVDFIENQGPVFANPIENSIDIKKLKKIDPIKDLNYLNKAITYTKEALGNKIPLIGFAGSPWTLATYMVEGKTSKQFNKIRALMYSDPAALHILLETVSQQVALSLISQIEHGANVVMLFDTWGGILSDDNYREYSLRYMEKIIGQIKSKFSNQPVILFTKNGGRCLFEQANVGADGIGIDWQSDLLQVRNEIGSKVAIQGNLDPCVLYASNEVIQDKVKQILNVMQKQEGYIFNLGHGILPDICPEKVDVMINTIKNYREA